MYTWKPTERSVRGGAGTGAPRMEEGEGGGGVGWRWGGVGGLQCYQRVNLKEGGRWLQDGSYWVDRLQCQCPNFIAWSGLHYTPTGLLCLAECNKKKLKKGWVGWLGWDVCVCVCVCVGGGDGCRERMRGGGEDCGERCAGRDEGGGWGVGWVGRDSGEGMRGGVGCVGKGIGEGGREWRELIVRKGMQGGQWAEGTAGMRM